MPSVQSPSPHKQPWWSVRTVTYLLVALLTTMVIGWRVAVLINMEQNTEPINIPSVKIVEPIVEEDPIEETVKKVTPAEKQTEELQIYLREFAHNQPVTFAVVVEDLKTGVRAGVFEKRVFRSASLYKSFVSQQLYRLIAEGRIKLDNSIKISKKRKETVGSCIEKMIIVSDNQCGQKGQLIMIDHDGDQAAADRFTSTDISGIVTLTTAYDVAELFRDMYTGDYLRSDLNRQWLTHHLNQQVNNRLPVGLPAGTKIAHKTGDSNGYVHDGGIVYTPKGAYLIVGMSGPWKDGVSEAYASFAELAAGVDSIMRK